MSQYTHSGFVCFAFTHQPGKMPYFFHNTFWFSTNFHEDIELYSPLISTGIWNSTNDIHNHEPCHQFWFASSHGCSKMALLMIFYAWLKDYNSSSVAPTCKTWSHRSTTAPRFMPSYAQWNVKTKFAMLTDNHNWVYSVSWHPIMWSIHCNSFEDQAPVDFIYGCLIFKWVSMS